MSIASNLDEVLAVLAPSPLRVEDLELYFIKTDKVRGSNIALRLEKYFIANKNHYKHVLLMGHRGSGKSTELAYFANQVSKEFRVISFSIQDEANQHDLSHVDMVFTILRKIFEAANEDDIDLNPEILERLDHYWNSEHFLEELKLRKSDYEASLQLKGGLLAFVSASIKGILHYGTESKEVVRSYIKPRISELTNSINALLLDLGLKYRALDKTPIIIVEDLDKIDLEVAKDLFLNHTNTLTSFHVHIIYTFPIFLNYSSESQYIGTLFDQRELLSMIKVRDREGKPFELGQKIIKEILAKRADLALFDKDALDFLIDKSGGCLRHLFEMLQNSVLETLTREQPGTKMDRSAAEKGYLLLRNNFERSITPTQLKALKKLHTSKDKSAWNDGTNLELLNSMAVIEYNGERWCGIHPVVQDLLQEKGQLGKSRRT